MKKYGWFLFLHLALLIYSTSSLFSKTASRQSFGSISFFFFYGGMILVLALYALLWQQAIKHLPITTAYANKAVTIVWGLIFGFFFFHETVSPRQMAGALVIIIGALLYVRADLEGKKDES